ncbi:MAG TPA: DUF2520 domain-containing protein [Mycobacteriales bacterium]|nr:DUF2520 domain-containing protein [Mycobacteriales bacterium]
MRIILPPDQRPARLTVGVVGAGRVGAVLGAALARAGHQVAAVAAVSEDSRKRAEELLPGADVLPVDEVAAIAELLVLAVPDDALRGLVVGLANSRVVGSGALVVHTSGAHGIEVLEPLTEWGALPLALHPVMTFTGTDVDLQRLESTCFGVTTTEPLRPVAEALVIEMGAEPVWIAEDQRIAYHAGLAFSANNLVTLVTEGSDLLRRSGVDHPQRMLGPLLGAALDNALRHGDRGLTGPVARGDAGTVAAHLSAIRSAAPEAVAAYVEMSRLTAARALAAGLISTAQAGELLDVLSGEEQP